MSTDIDWPRLASPFSNDIAAALVTLKAEALRELHWHPNASEWRFWLAGKGRMTVIMNEGRACTKPGVVTKAKSPDEEVQHVPDCRHVMMRNRVE